MAKWMMYVGCYTDETEDGIHIFALDEETGKLSEAGSAEASNSSYLLRSPVKPVIYSITDMGVAAYAIEKDGTLTLMNEVPTKAMRGCYLCCDSAGKYLFAGGFHDGKITMLSLNEDGSIGSVVDRKRHRNPGTGINRNDMCHVTCINLTSDDKYLCASDSGLDQVMIYKVDQDLPGLELSDVLRCDLDYDPARIVFTKDGQNAYILSESMKQISVYRYEEKDNTPVFTLLQKISTIGVYHTASTHACSLRLAASEKYVIVSNDGDNTVAFYEREPEGTLILYCVLPISGKYPKDALLSPDHKYLYAVNHDENSITTFRMNYQEKLFSMCAKPVKISAPNSAVIVDLEKLFAAKD